MRRLHVDQIVSLSLDEERHPIPCRVLGVEGSLSRLAYLNELSPQVVGRLVNGWSGYLVFNAFRAAIGLRVAVRTNPPYLDVAVIDGIAMPERRKQTRVRTATPARIISPDADAAESEPVWTDTLDLSERGALLHHDAALDGQRRVGLELMFGDDPIPVSAEAAIVRRQHHAVGIVFESMPAADATRLHEYLMGLRHQPRPSA